MYTEAELKAIRAAERKIDMVRDAAHQSQYTDYRKERAAHQQRLAAERAARNPDLATRLAAIKNRMNDGNRLIAQQRTADLMRLQVGRVVSSSTEPAPF